MNCVAEKQVELFETRGIQPWQTSAWIHTHPAGVERPSSTDEETMRESFGAWDFVAMIILTKSGRFFALRTVAAVTRAWISTTTSEAASASASTSSAGSRIQVTVAEINVAFACRKNAIDGTHAPIVGNAGSWSRPRYREPPCVGRQANRSGSETTPRCLLRAIPGLLLRRLDKSQHVLERHIAFHGVTGSKHITALGTGFQ